MPDFLAVGSMTLANVTFYVTAANVVEAKRKFKVGEYDDYEDADAGVSSVSINASTVETNEVLD
jgi:hypothetical protein